MDILYVFNFESRHIEGALKRFRHSLASLDGQGARICVSNNSKNCILSRIKDVAKNLTYIHKPYFGQFSRAHGINFGVRSLVRSEYFMISDVDLVYRRDHLVAVKSKMLDALNKTKQPVRMVFWNYNLKPRYNPAWMDVPFFRRFALASPRMESSDYEALYKLPHNGGGFAHGNGIIHLESFMRLQGYDEEMIGYGPEDDLFNTRIGRVNNIVYDKGNDTASIHLWHPRLQMIQWKENMKIWRERKAHFQTLENPTWDDVMANRSKSTWGEIF